MEAVTPAASSGAPDGTRPEANTLLHLVPSRLPVCLCGPKPAEPGQQALLSPLCGQPAWRGIWGPGRGATTEAGVGGVLCISTVSGDRGLGGLSYTGLGPLQMCTHCHTGSFCALPTEDPTKVSRGPQRATGTRPCAWRLAGHPARPLLLLVSLPGLPFPFSSWQILTCPSRLSPYVCEAHLLF